MTAVAKAVVYKYPAVIYRSEHCPLLAETVVSITIALAEDKSSVIDAAVIPDSFCQNSSPAYRMIATAHAERLGASLYMEEVH